MASTVVEVPMHYLKDLRLYDTEKPFAYETGPSYEDPTVSNISHELHPVSLENIRGRENEFNYDQHSFAFVRHQSVIDFSQPNQDSLGYILENTQILKDQFNTDQVICYDLRRRSSNPNRDEVMPIAENTFTQARMPAPPVDAVHNDHTRLGGFHRARRHMSDDEITEFLDSGKWRVRIVNTWRPINKVDAFPLALCDHRTVDKDDLVETDVVNEDYVGETYSVKYNPKHLFYWLKDQRPDELCVFVTFDSQNSPAGSAITTCPHGSFDNPWSDPLAPPRESIEVRSLVMNFLGDLDAEELECS